MDSNVQKRINEIFLRACDMPEVELPEFLDSACKGDSLIRREVENLLNADKETDGQLLPDPPMQPFLQSVHRIFDELDSGQMNCEQCGSTLESEEGNSGSICAECGGSTRTLFPAEAEAFESLVRLYEESRGRFHVNDCLGEGSYGIVYKAWDTRLRRDVALKVPKGQLVSRTLFIREARISSQLRHENIVRIYDVNDADEFAYIVSDFIDGSALNLWRKRHPLSVRESCELCRIIANAMDYAHRSGVIHRDLKPSNIVMDDAGKPNILDFGLSKSLATQERSLVKAGTPIGTPAFMSPEQVTGNSKLIANTSDVYSLGVILYQLLTDQLPFSGEGIYHDICNDLPRPICEINPRLAPALNAIVMKSMAKNPQDRYLTAHDMANDLNRYLRGQRVEAYPKIDARVIGTKVRKWSLPSAVGVLSLLLVITGIAIWSIYNANNPRVRVIVGSSPQDTEIQWFRYDEATGRLDDQPVVGVAGKPIRIQPGFYKLRLPARQPMVEVFRTVPFENQEPVFFGNIMLPHRMWDQQSNPIVLPEIPSHKSQAAATGAKWLSQSIPVKGGTLSLGNDESISHLFRNVQTEISDFRITHFELGIDEIRELFPNYEGDSVNFEIVVAFAEQVGAQIPTIEEYFYIEQSGINIDDLKTGRKEWTESPVHEVVIPVGDSTFRSPADLNQRWVLNVDSAVMESGFAVDSITGPDFVLPSPTKEGKADYGFRLIWRY